MIFEATTNCKNLKKFLRSNEINEPINSKITEENEQRTINENKDTSDPVREKIKEVEDSSDSFSDENEGIKGISDYVLDFSALRRIRMINKGASGVVYLMEDDENRKYAVKEIEASGDEKHGEYFMREVEILSEAIHPCIMRIFGFCFESQEGKAKIALEYLENGSMKSKMFNHELNPTQKAKIVVGICLGMRYLHFRGVIHRDLKPENILLNRKFEVKIGDFGISKFYDEGDNNTMTKSIGTPIYSAPEVINHSEYDISADVYSFGLILLEMVNERPVYENIDLFGVLRKKMENEYGEISNSCKDVTREIIENCLKADKEYRPSFEQLADVILKANFNLFGGEDVSKVKKYYERVTSEEEKIKQLLS